MNALQKRRLLKQLEAITGEDIPVYGPPLPPGFQSPAASTAPAAPAASSAAEVLARQQRAREREENNRLYQLRAKQGAARVEGATAKELLIRFGSTVVGGAAGALLWKQHRVLGALAGMDLGNTAAVSATGTPSERKHALISFAAITPAATAGSLLWKKHPVWGWLIGFVLAWTPVTFLTYEMREKAQRERNLKNATLSATVL